MEAIIKQALELEKYKNEQEQKEYYKLIRQMNHEQRRILSEELSKEHIKSL